MSLNLHLERLQRLVAIDAALASAGGMQRAELAEQLGVSYKTIQRDHELLRSLTGDNCVYSRPEDTGFYIWWYSDRRRRVFRQWLGEIG